MIVAVAAMRVGCRVIDRLVVWVIRLQGFPCGTMVRVGAWPTGLVPSDPSCPQPRPISVLVIVRTGEEVVMMPRGSTHVDVMARHHHLTPEPHEGQGRHQQGGKG